MSGAVAWCRNLVHQEPIIFWSCFIGGLGLALPIVVPPIRESLGQGRKYSPPPVKELIQTATAKQGR